MGSACWDPQWRNDQKRSLKSGIFYLIFSLVTEMDAWPASDSQKYPVTKLPKIGYCDYSQMSFWYSRIISQWQLSACDYFLPCPEVVIISDNHCSCIQDVLYFLQGVANIPCDSCKARFTQLRRKKIIYTMIQVWYFTNISITGHPADDIAHFLYSSTSKAFRDIYEDLCLRTYFSIFKVRCGVLK